MAIHSQCFGPLERRVSEAEDTLAALLLRLERRGQYDAAARLNSALAALISGEIALACDSANSQLSTLDPQLPWDPYAVSVLDGLSQASQDELL